MVAKKVDDLELHSNQSHIHRTANSTVCAPDTSLETVCLIRRFDESSQSNSSAVVNFCTENEPLTMLTLLQRLELALKG